MLTGGWRLEVEDFGRRLPGWFGESWFDVIEHLVEVAVVNV